MWVFSSLFSQVWWDKQQAGQVLAALDRPMSPSTVSASFPGRCTALHRNTVSYALQPLSRDGPERFFSVCV